MKIILLIIFIVAAKLAMAGDTSFVFAHPTKAKILAFVPSVKNKLVYSWYTVEQNNKAKHFIAFCDSRTGFILKQIDVNQEIKSGQLTPVCLNIDSKEQKLVSLLADGRVLVWNLFEKKLETKIQLRKCLGGDVFFSKDSDMLVVHTFTKEIQNTKETKNKEFQFKNHIDLIKLSNGSIIKAFSGDEWNSGVYTFDRESETALIAAKDGKLLLKSTENGHTLGNFDTGKNKLLSICFLPSKKLAATIFRTIEDFSVYDSIGILDIQTGKFVAKESYIDKSINLDSFNVAIDSKCEKLFLYPQTRCDAFPVLVFRLNFDEKGSFRSLNPEYEFNIDLLKINGSIHFWQSADKFYACGSIPSAEIGTQDILALYDETGIRLFPKIDYAQNNTFFLFEQIHEDYLFEIDHLFLDNQFQENGVQLKKDVIVKKDSEFEWFAWSPTGYYAGSSPSIRQSGYYVNDKVYESEQYFLLTYRPDQLLEAIDGDSSLILRLKDIYARNIESFDIDKVTESPEWNEPEVRVISATRVKKHEPPVNYELNIEITDAEYNINELFYMQTNLPEMKLQKIDLLPQNSKIAKLSLKFENISWGTKIELYANNVAGVFSKKMIVIAK